MITYNKAEEVGDVILMATEAPILGIVALTGYTDSTENESGSRYFKKEFSYSIDGIFFSDWIDLTDLNLANIVVNQTDPFHIQYRYTRQGDSYVEDLIFHDVTLLGEFVIPTCQNYKTLPKTIFRDIFCYNPKHIQLCINLTKKYYEQGIIPSYIERGQTDNPQIDDRDYLDFWDAVCCYFALIIVYIQDFEDFDQEKFVVPYLQQNDLYL